MDPVEPLGASPTQAMPRESVLLVQLKELNERSRTYARQLWQVSFAYLAGAGVVVVQAADGKHGALALVLVLATSGVVGVFVVWHLASLCDAARRSYEGLKAVEGQLSLRAPHTQWSPGHLYTCVILTALASVAALVTAAFLWRW